MMLMLTQTAYLRGVYIAVLILSILVAVAITVTASILIVRVVKRVRWRPARRSYALNLKNDGNVNGVYLLKAVDDFGDLDFSYYSNGKKMKCFQEQTVGRYVSKQSTPVLTQQKTEFVPVEPIEQEDEKKSLKDEVKDKSQQAQDGANKVMGKGRIMVSILSTLGGLLPGELGSSLKDTATSMQGRLQAADDTMGKPEMMIRQVQSVESQAGNLAGKNSKKEKKTAKKKEAKKAASNLPLTDQSPTLQVSSKERGTDSIDAPLEYQQTGVITDGVSINDLKPGDNRTIELRVEPKNPFIDRTYHFEILVQQIEQNGFQAMEEILPHKIREQLVFTGIADRYRTFSILMSVLGILFIVLLNGVWVLTVVNALSTRL
jgi:hypothetical protein